MRPFDQKQGAEPAYDLWAPSYDAQPDNLVLALDGELFNSFIEESIVKNKLVADVGCGTGRHWKTLLDFHPAALYGFDISQGMLDQLKGKFPKAMTTKQTDYKLPRISDHFFDTVVSTLALAHMKDPGTVLAEWNRVLKPGGQIIITDYHPEALSGGSYRTFRQGGKLIAVESFIYPLTTIIQSASGLGLQKTACKEKFIDVETRPYYERQNALPIYERFFGLPLLYAIRLKKPA